MFCAFIARAQDPGTVEFDQAADKHRKEFETLLNNKLAPRLAFPDGDANHQTIVAALKDFPAGTALIFYDYDSESQQFRLWLVDAGGIRHYVAAKQRREELERVIAMFRRALGVEALQMTRSPHIRGTQTPFLPKSIDPLITLNEAIASLTKVLLPPPIEARLEHVRHLIVVAAGAIGTIPFAVLQPFGTKEYLIDRMSISYAASLYELAREVKPWTPDFLPAVVVGNPDLKSISDWEFPDLKGADEEARVIADLIKSRPLVGAQATKDAVLDAVGTAKFLYFATHGVADSEASLDGSFLALASNRAGDGKWTMREIERRYYGRTHLAVLSACQTGLGQVYDGGIMHLARTFQVSGVPRVVMSLWRVDDGATADLMISFIKQLQTRDNDMMPAEALRRAMVETKKRRPEPREWAPFVLFGIPR